MNATRTLHRRIAALHASDLVSVRRVGDWEDEAVSKARRPQNEPGVGDGEQRGGTAPDGFNYTACP